MLPISGNNASRIFNVASGATVTLNYLALQNGLAKGSGSAAQGGAIFNQGNLTLNNMLIQNNLAQGSDGAAGGKNHFDGYAGQAAAGGAIWSNGTLTLGNGTILQINQAMGGQGGVGYFGLREDKRLPCWI